MKRNNLGTWTLILLFLGSFVIMGQSCPLICTDEDGDGFAIEGGTCGDIDCDDKDAEINPAAEEACGDGVDNNCDGSVDEGCDLAFVGSNVCQGCHSAIYDDFIVSGHPFKFNLIDQDSPAAPTYPSFVNNYMALPYNDMTWADVAGVIGGFSWKARFVDTTGVIVGTASSVIHPGEGQNQLNFFEFFEDAPTWSDYNADSENKEYNQGCFKCHTTGAVSAEETDKNWIEEHLGIDNDRDLGFFEFAGVQCEACHGMGSDHAASMDAKDILHPEGDEVNDLCGSCHFRLSDHLVQASGDFIRHHEQYDEFIHTKHFLEADMNCSSCHDPHKRVVWSGDGIKTTCESCHSSVKTAGPHASTDCITCHMAFIGKSAQATGFLKGDIRSHSFSINTDPDYQMLGPHPTDEDTNIMVVDSEGLTHIGLKYVCYQCHNTPEGEGGGGSEKTLEELSTYAEETMHQ